MGGSARYGVRARGRAGGCRVCERQAGATSAHFPAPDLSGTIVPRIHVVVVVVVVVIGAHAQDGRAQADDGDLGRQGECVGSEFRRACARSRVADAARTRMDIGHAATSLPVLPRHLARPRCPIHPGPARRQTSRQEMVGTQPGRGAIPAEHLLHHARVCANDGHERARFARGVAVVGAQVWGREYGRLGRVEDGCEVEEVAGMVGCRRVAGGITFCDVSIIMSPTLLPRFRFAEPY